MKTLLLKFILPISMVLVLVAITAMALLSGCQKNTTCASGSILGKDGVCYGSCAAGDYATLTPSGSCSAPSAGGVYCCSGSSSNNTGGPYCNTGYTYNYSSQKCCPNSTPYYYPGTHGIDPAGCYASCPYVGDCGTSYTRY